jgi:hypothetical protein
MNWVTPWSGTQNDDYDRHKTAGRYIVVGGRWKLHVHATDQHHLARGAITEIRWTPSHATEMTWLVAIVESTKKTVTRLLAPTSNQTWLRVAVRNHKLGIAMRGIKPRAEYQRERTHSQVSNGSLKNLNWSTVQVPWLFARRRVCWKLQFWTDCSAKRKPNSGAVRVGFSPWVEYQKVGQLSQLSFGYLYSLNGLTV